MYHRRKVRSYSQNPSKEEDQDDNNVTTRVPSSKTTTECASDNPNKGDHPYYPSEELQQQPNKKKQRPKPWTIRSFYFFVGWFCFIWILVAVTNSFRTNTRPTSPTHGNPQELGSSLRRNTTTLLMRHPSNPSVLQSNANVHIVFSTDCSGYQHWQGIALYYSAVFVNHQGPITRIASGCSDSQKEAIQNEWYQINNRTTSRYEFRVHFTPTFSSLATTTTTTTNNSTSPSSLKQKKTNYKYGNKPGGLYHWLHNADIQERYICLLDPDMLLFKPITSNLMGSTTLPTKMTKSSDWVIATKERHKGRQVEYYYSYDTNSMEKQVLPNRTTTGRILRMKRLPEVRSYSLQDGMPSGQHFGLGSAWTETPKPGKKGWHNFSKAHVCTAATTNTNRCIHISKKEVDDNYAVGPVYIATQTDWLRISKQWWEFVPRVYEQYPYLLAEMYAFVMAVTYLDIKFTLVSSYMISDPSTSSLTEAWTWIDDYFESDSNEGAMDDTLLSLLKGLNKSSSSSSNSNFGNGQFLTLDHHQQERHFLPNSQESKHFFPLPTTLHYCQRYIWNYNDDDNNNKREDQLLFSKRKVPHDFFNCHGTPLKQLDFERINIPHDNNNNKQKQKRTIFMLYHITRIMNMALQSYKEDVCRH